MGCDVITSITQYTDESFIVTVDNYDLTTAQSIHITFKQLGTAVDVTDVIVQDEHHCAFRLTQSQTGLFCHDLPGEVQINVVDSDGRSASGTVPFRVEKNLLRRPI